MPTAPASSVITRVADVLNMFSPRKALVSIDEIAACLDVSTASAYRYASELSNAGLLSRTSGHYRLGPKIIELEYLIRSYDPIIRAGHSLMTGLAELTGCDVLLCNIYDLHVVNVHHIRGGQPMEITYTKGLPMPIFRGSQAHVVLAHMDRRKLKRIHDQAVLDPELRPDVHAIGETWQEFTRTLKQIRSQGYYISRGELDADVTGIAAPVFGDDKEIVASLVLSRRSSLPSRLSEEALINLVVEAAREISRRIDQAALVETELVPAD